MEDPKRIVIVGGPHHRTLLALETLSSSVNYTELDQRTSPVATVDPRTFIWEDANPSTANLGEGETNDAFFESIAGVDYAEVERRFMVLDPKAFMREVPIAGREGYVVVDELTGVELATMKTPYEGNRKQRRAQAARARDKRWRIKL